MACTVVEAEARWGGKILTRHAEGFVMEAGPDSFLAHKPWGVALCRDLGLEDQLVNTNPSREKAWVWSRGRLRPLPEGLVVISPSQIGPFLRSGLLSPAGLIRMGLDLLLPAKRTEEDESVAAFFRRRFGREAFERFIEPLMAGIYAGDAEQMSLRATFPRFAELEQRYGSVIRGMLAGSGPSTGRTPGTPQRTMFVTLRGGLGTLVEALIARLSSAGVRLLAARRASALRPAAGGGYELTVSDGERLRADAVILATPAFVSADLLAAHNPEAADLLAAIPYASTATVSLAYEATARTPAVRGFGFVVPRVEQRPLLAATWTSLKWPDRAPQGAFLIRCYLGGVGREGWLKADDATLVEMMRAELRAIVDLRAEPILAEVTRWDRGMPQYHVGHVERVERIERALRASPGLYAAGAAYRGLGIPDCIRDGIETAERLLGEGSSNTRDT